MTDGQVSRVEALFQDVYGLHRDALRELELVGLRNAAEKAWGATMRATAALILARTGVELERSDQVSRALRRLSLEDPQVARRLLGPYYTRLNILHGDCFYLGILEPPGDIERLIRQTNRYICSARALAGDRR